MRADRLLSLLLLLQTRGRLTAGELARELEVCERTVYRDIDALSTAGVPVFGERGPDGGYSLMDGYRTSLTGLTGDEVRAFFMLSIPAPLADLRLNQEMKGALLKLSAALPPGRRAEEDRVRRRFYVDVSWWNQTEEPAPHLQTIELAVWEDREITIEYSMPPALTVERTVQPYGLVAKSGIWFLVYCGNGKVLARRVSELRSVRLSAHTFQRPAEFDLAGFWQDWCREYEGRRRHYRVLARVAPGFVDELARHVGQGIRERIAPAAGDGDWPQVELAFASLEEARSRILSFGSGVEVVEPLALRLSLQDFAQQIAAVYNRSGG